MPGNTDDKYIHYPGKTAESRKIRIAREGMPELHPESGGFHQSLADSTIAFCYHLRSRMELTRFRMA